MATTTTTSGPLPGAAAERLATTVTTLPKTEDESANVESGTTTTATTTIMRRDEKHPEIVVAIAVAAEEETGGGGGGSEISNNAKKAQAQTNAREAKCLTFYKNGDRYFKGIRIQLTPQRYLNFSHLLADLTKWISLPYGVRRLYSCEEGRLVDTFDAMLDGEVYICASFEKFKPLQYGHGLGAPTFKGGQIRGKAFYSNGNLRNLPPLENGLSPQVQRKTLQRNLSHPAQIGDVAEDRTRQSVNASVPAATSTMASNFRRQENTRRSHILSTRRENAGGGGGDIESRVPPVDGPTSKPGDSQKNVAFQETDKPKILTIVRHGKRPRKSIKFTMPKKVRSVDQLLVDITNAFEPRYRTSKLNKLYTIDGDEVSKVDELIESKESAVYVGVGEHETVSSSDFLSVRREIYGKLKTLTKYSKIKSQAQSENSAPSSTAAAAVDQSKTTAASTTAKVASTKSPPLVKTHPRPSRAPQQTSSSRHVPSISDTVVTRIGAAATTRARDFLETEDEASSSCEKHTGKDSGIEDEDTPRESEQGSKLSLLERTSVDYEEETVVEREEQKGKRKNQGNVPSSQQSVNVKHGLRVDRIRQEVNSRNRNLNLTSRPSRGTPSSPAEGTTTTTTSSGATIKTLKNSPNKRATDLPPLKGFQGGRGDFHTRLKKEQEVERQKQAMNRDEIAKREEQRERLWLQRKAEMLRRVRTSAVGGVKRRRRRSDSAASTLRQNPANKSTPEHHRSVEEVSSNKHKIEATLELEELRPIEEKTRSRSGSGSGSGDDGSLQPQVTSPDVGNQNKDEDFEHVIVETQREKPLSAEALGAEGEAEVDAAANCLEEDDFEIVDVVEGEIDVATSKVEGKLASAKIVDGGKVGKNASSNPSPCHTGIICDIHPVKVVHDRYSLGKQIGDGNFAVVRTCRASKKLIQRIRYVAGPALGYGATAGLMGSEFAMKVIDKTKLGGKEEMVRSEVGIMKQCSHANIVQLLEEFETKDNIYLVMELVKDGDLFDAITRHQKFEERVAARMVRDVASALDYLHASSIVHRDLKPENLLVVYGKEGAPALKLADFGLAMVVDEPLVTVCGTPTYVAPEILTETGYGLPVDIWALGIITYILLCGFPPFRSPERRQSELFEIIKRGEFEYLSPYWDSISSTACDLIDAMLDMDTRRRYQAQHVLNHKWILKHCNHNHRED